MKTSEIQVGKTYTNKSGSRMRTVVAIEQAPGGCKGVDVSYATKDGGGPGVVFLSSFAAWAHREVLPAAH